MNKWFSAIAMGAAAVLLHSHAYAQTVDVPVEKQTPPELKDFRLDEPKPEPQAAPPPAVPTLPPEQPRQEAPAPQRENQAPAPRPTPVVRGAPQPAPAAVQPAAAGSAEVPSPVLPSAPSDAGPAAETPSATPDPAPQTTAAVADNGSNGIATYWLWWAAAGILLLLGIGAYWASARRNRVARQDPIDDAEPAYQPSPPARLPLASEPPAPARITLETEFTPLYAQLSIANLTIVGKLSIKNVGDDRLEAITVRSSMISAREGQDAAIAAFHNDQSQGHNDSIGSANAGEVIDVTIEIQSPRTELQSFLWTNRQFLAPILLINLKGESEHGPVESRLSCLIGREATPPAPRMKPLPIDRGPKRFEGIGFRPVMS
jgi:hypothetical protein